MPEEIIFGSLSGLAFGFFIGFFKYYLLWRPVIIRPTQQNETGSAFVLGYIIRYLISFFVDIIALFCVYIFREHLPWNYFYILIGTAVSLSIVSMLFAIKSKISGKAPVPLDKDSLSDNGGEA